VTLDLPPSFYYSLAYVFALIVGLVVVNLALNRLTREERRAERARRLEARNRRLR
jgi:hypothetical protein